MIANGADAIPDTPDGRETQDLGRVARPTEVQGWFNRPKWLAALAGVLAGLLAFGVGEAIYKLIPPKTVRVPTSGSFVIAPTAATQVVADMQNAALAFGLLGACLGGCLGIAGGLARRSLFGTMLAGLLGATLGAALPAGISMASIKSFANAQVIYSQYDLFISMAMHGLIWGPAGAAAGLAFAVGLGSQPRRLAQGTVAGLAGAVIGAIAFDMIGAGLFPLAETGEPISTTWPSRLTARLLVCVTTAVLVILTVPAPNHAEAAGHSALH